MKKTTLAELGSRLPIGFQEGNTLQKDFGLRPFKTKVDRHLAAWIKNNAGKHDDVTLEACKVAKLLSLLVSHVNGAACPVTPQGDSTPEFEAQIYNWFFADVMYAYMYARVEALGSTMLLPVVCPNCRYSTEEAKVDLSTTEISTVESVEELYKWVDLQHPLLLRDGRTTLQSVKIGPVRWSTYCKPGVLASEVAAFDPTSLRDSICAINRDDSKAYSMTNAEIDELHKLDFERINHQAGAVLAGPDITTTVRCPSCNFPITGLLQWTYNFFFGLSFHVEDQI